MDKIQKNFRIASEYSRAGKLEPAARHLRMILDEDAGNALALHALGVIAIRSGKQGEAEAHVRQAIAINEKEPRYWHTLACVLFSRNQVDDAENALATANRYGMVDSAEVSDMKGRLSLRKNKRSDAINYFQAVADKTTSRVPVKVTAFNYKDSMDPIAHARGKPYVKELDNVMLDTAYWLVFDGNDIYSDEISGRNIANCPLVRNRISSDRKTVIVDMEEPAMEYSDPVVFLGGDHNYCHWLIRYLSRLALIEDNTELKKLPVLVREDLRPYQVDSLNLAGIPESSRILVPKDRIIRCRKLYLPTTLRNERDISRGCKWLRKKLPDCNQGQSRDFKRLYVSRNDITMRRLLNEAELESGLRERGFEIVNPGTLPFSQQIECFSRAEIVVGPHGAGLTNIVFAPENCRVLELSDRLIAHMPDFRWIANAMGQTIITLVSDDVELIPGGKLLQRDHHFRINVAEALTAVDKLIASIP